MREIDKTCAVIRPRVAAMEEQLGWAFPVLDHGFVRVVDYMGDDKAIVQSARVSYGEGTKTVQNDRGLIRYLMNHQHTTPFEMCELKLHVKLPVFVARQWIRHRTANVNEYSARYSILENEFYIPDTDHILPQSTDNKQGRGGDMLEANKQYVQEMFRMNSKEAYDTYALMIQEDGLNVARELARMNLPTNIYTQWYWKVNLHNLFHFLRLRADSHAQYEIRVYADAICKIVSQWVPLAFEAFEDYRMNAENFSAHEVEVLSQFVRMDELDFDSLTPNNLMEYYGFSSKREAADFLRKLRDKK